MHSSCFSHWGGYDTSFVPFCLSFWEGIAHLFQFCSHKTYPPIYVGSHPCSLQTSISCYFLCCMCSYSYSISNRSVIGLFQVKCETHDPCHQAVSLSFPIPLLLISLWSSSTDIFLLKPSSLAQQAGLQRCFNLTLSDGSHHSTEVLFPPWGSHGN